MEQFPTDEITVPEGLTESEQAQYLRRAKFYHRQWVAETAANNGKTFEAVQAFSLSPSEEAILEHFGGIARAQKEETGTVQPSDLDSWRGGADSAHSWLFNFWVSDMAEFDQATGWTMTDYGIEVLDALEVQHSEGR